MDSVISSARRLARVSAEPVPPTVLDVDAFRGVAGRFATGISVVATRNDGVDHAMTLNAFTSVSLKPLVVLICVEKITRFHRAVMASGAWAMSMLSDDAEQASRWFAEKARPTGGQLADYTYHPGAATGMPVLDMAMAVIECRTRAVHDGGDHDVVLGDVVGLWTDPAARPPLVYFEGRYRQLR
jgi:flavin reductase (DIM6/NTAB) family NADH-FMN oxidoreductase RutF